MNLSLHDLILKFAIGFPLFERFAVSFFRRFEGGDIRSNNLRKLYAKRYRIEVGEFTYGCFTPNFNFGGGQILIGRYCSIASGVRFLGANHPINHFSTSAVFYNKSLGYDVKDINRHNLTIEDDVWIGLNAVITCGCRKIGRGAVIGAGSVVTKDVESYTVVGGVPAKIIRRRFENERIKKLELSKWWEKSPLEILKEYEGEIE